MKILILLLFSISCLAQTDTLYVTEMNGNGTPFIKKILTPSGKSSLPQYYGQPGQVLSTGTGTKAIWSQLKTINGTNLLGSGNIVIRGYSINVLALTSSPADAQTIYFGILPKAPVTTQGTSKIYIRQAGTIKRAEIYCFSGTAGTAEAWPISIRLNNSGDTQIASVSAATSERVFSNAALNIAVVPGDYIEIKSVNPTWVTNPLTCIFGGYIYIE